jgi:beta-glucosidase-like glycosyl hydrolase
MSNFKEATRMKLRVNTSVGELSVEQLWDLSLTKLAATIKNVKKQLQKDNDDELSFLDEDKKVDRVLQLTFDVLKEVYQTKQTEQVEARTALERKANNEKIMALIAKKQESELEGKSVEELQALLQ